MKGLGDGYSGRVIGRVLGGVLGGMSLEQTKQARKGFQGGVGGGGAWRESFLVPLNMHPYSAAQQMFSPPPALSQSSVLIRVRIRRFWA